METEALEILEEMGFDTAGWEIEDSICVTPCGCTIEWDGGCSHGIESPFLTMGMI